MADSPPPPTPMAMSDQPAEGPPGAPRWVKISGIVLVVLVLGFAVSRLAGVEHGPGRHTGSGVSPGHTPPAAVTDGEVPPGAAGGGHTGPPPGVTHGADEP